jgi:hypothetical protein
MSDSQEFGSGDERSRRANIGWGVLFVAAGVLLMFTLDSLGHSLPCVVAGIVFFARASSRRGGLDTPAPSSRGYSTSAGASPEIRRATDASGSPRS